LGLKFTQRGDHGLFDRDLFDSLRAGNTPSSMSSVVSKKSIQKSIFKGDAMVVRNIAYLPSMVPMYTPVLNAYKNRSTLYRTLYWIAVGGFSTRPDLALAMRMDMKTTEAKKASLRTIARACATLEKESLIVQTPANLWRMKLNLIRLTNYGVDYCVKSFDWPVIWNDWDKLIHHHNGLEYIRHSAAVLIFAYHVRLRGWEAEVLPYEQLLNTEPDLLIKKQGIKLFVEIEMKASHAAAKQLKWSKQNQLQGCNAICMLSTQGAENIARILRKRGVSRYYVASIQHLLRTTYHLNGPGDLWSTQLEADDDATH
jgi:hypothetical protein